MPNAYTGAVVPPVSQDGPPPLPGGAPVKQLPTGPDAFNAAAFYQMEKADADYIAYLMASARWRPPLTYGAVAGFTAVAHVGAGTGTVTPSAPSSAVQQRAHGPYSVVVKIIVGGAVATATFQWSNDGGTTWSATQTTAATYQDPTSLITVAFAGTFTANDTYAFQPAFTPIAAFADAGGKVRHVLDHNGYPLGRRSELREEWWFDDPNGNIGGGTFVFPGNRWQIAGTADAANTYTVATDGVTFPAKVVTVTNNTPNGNKIYVQTKAGVFFKLADTVSVLEWEAFISAAGANNTLVMMGFSDVAAGTMSASTNAKLWFEKASANNNWQVRTLLGTVDTGVAPVANTFQRFRIETHGVNTPLGVALGGTEVALFFIDEKFVAVATTGLAWGLASARLSFGCENSGVLGGTFKVGVSPLLFTFNRYPSLPAL